MPKTPAAPVAPAGVDPRMAPETVARVGKALAAVDPRVVESVAFARNLRRNHRLRLKLGGAFFQAAG